MAIAPWDKAYVLTVNGENRALAHREYVVDDTADLANLPTTDEILMGSLAYVISEGKIYALNSSDEWK